MTRKRSGALVFTTGFVLLAGLAAAVPYYNVIKRQSNAEGLALEWAAKIYPGEKATSICQGTDSDGDGYVSCTVKVGQDRVPLDCHSYLYLALGNTCREQMPRLRKTGS